MRTIPLPEGAPQRCGAAILGAGMRTSMPRPPRVSDAYVVPGSRLVAHRHTADNGSPKTSYPWHRPRYSHPGRSSAESSSSGSGDESLRPLLRSPAQDRQVLQKSGSGGGCPSTVTGLSERFRWNNGLALADVQVVRHTGPRLGASPTLAKKFGRPIARPPRHFQNLT